MCLFSTVFLFSLWITDGKIIIIYFSSKFILKSLYPFSICFSTLSQSLLTTQFYSYLPMFICHSSISLVVLKSLLIFWCCSINVKLIQICDLVICNQYRHQSNKLVSVLKSLDENSVPHPFQPRVLFPWLNTSVIEACHQLWHIVNMQFISS